MPGSLYTQSDSCRWLSGHEDGAGRALGGGAKAGLGGAGPFLNSQDTPFSLPQEPEAQAAQVSDVPATSQRPEQVSGAVAGVLGPCLPAGPDTPIQLACASQDTRAAQEQELESLREQLEGVKHNIEEVEANMKTLGISLVQVGGGGGSQWGLEGLEGAERTL